MTMTANFITMEFSPHKVYITSNGKSPIHYGSLSVYLFSHTSDGVKPKNVPNQPPLERSKSEDKKPTLEIRKMDMWSPTLPLETNFYSLHKT